MNDLTLDDAADALGELPAALTGDGTVTLVLAPRADGSSNEDVLDALMARDPDLGETDDADIDLESEGGDDGSHPVVQMGQAVGGGLKATLAAGVASTHTRSGQLAAALATAAVVVAGPPGGGDE